MQSQAAQIAYSRSSLLCPLWQLLRWSFSAMCKWELCPLKRWCRPVDWLTSTLNGSKHLASLPLPVFNLVSVPVPLWGEGSQMLPITSVRKSHRLEGTNLWSQGILTRARHQRVAFCMCELEKLLANYWGTSSPRFSAVDMAIRAAHQIHYSKAGLCSSPALICPYSHANQ